MQTEAPTPAQDAWLRAVLGVDAGGATAEVSTPDPSSPVSRAARDPAVWTQPIGAAMTRQGALKAGSRVRTAKPLGPAAHCTGPTGKAVIVETDTDGRVAVTRDAPPITTVTFSGGGGKGAALPGALRALKAAGVLDTLKCMHGASVGSMTAAMVAAGVTPEAFQALSEETDWKSVIKGGEAVEYHVQGKRLEALVRNSMRSSVSKQVSAFAEAAHASGTTLDKATLASLELVTGHLAKAGPTFMDLRLLAAFIPGIKEVVISATLIGRSGPPKKGQAAGKVEKQKGELVIFSADTQPDMEVALAVHASAALPPIFKPVDIEQQSGEVLRFEDGGVMNNAPTPESIGEDRNVDPTPNEASLTFVFEDDNSRQIMQGTATPSRNRGLDKLTEAEFGAATYDKNRGLADRPEDVVMVPLKFTAKGGGAKDFSGDWGGTANFEIAREDQVVLQGMAEAETGKHLKKRKLPETRTYASTPQMLACVARDDLVAMASSDFPGAKDALAFRDLVDTQVAALVGLAAQQVGAADPKVRAILAGMDAAAQGDQERVGYVGRALNRSGKLDALLQGAKGAKGEALDSLAAGVAVAAALAARKTARGILRTTVYPKMAREGPKGPMGALLAQIDTMLRDARSGAEINRALRIGIGFFAARTDPRGMLGHKDFAAALTRLLQPDE